MSLNIFQQGQANFSHKGPESKYSQLCETSLLQYSSLLLLYHESSPNNPQTNEYGCVPIKLRLACGLQPVLQISRLCVKAREMSVTTSCYVRKAECKSIDDIKDVQVGGYMEP